MTSEIRANTIKNRVGLGTVSFTNTGPVVSGIVTANGLELNSLDTGSSAGPELKLFRNSASPADADYLGQLKFAGESDTGVERNYAKITGKILDASNGTEDGILEFAHIKAGSQTITGRWRSDSLQLLNGTSLTVAGTSEFTGAATLGGDLIIPDYIKHLGDTNTMIGFPSNDSFSVTTNNVTRMTFTGNFIDLPDAGTFRFGGSQDLQIYHGSGGASNIVHSNTSQPLIISATGAGSIRFDTNSGSRLLIDSSGNVDIATGQLTISNDIKSSDDDFYVYSYKGGSDGQVRSGIQFDSNSQRLRFFTATNERARILSGGEFAIGGSGYVGQPFSLQTSSTNLGYMETTSTTRGVMTFRDGNSTQNIGFGCIGNNHVFMKDGNEKIRIDASGRLLIGTTTEGYSGGDDLTISASGDTGMTIRSGTSSQGTIAFSDATSGVHEYRGYIQYLHNGDALLFGTASTERFRIASDGKLTIKNASGMMIDLQSSAGTGSAWIEFSDTDGTRKGYLGYGSSSSEKVYWVQQKSADMAIYSNNADRFNIQSNGTKVVRNGHLNILSTYIDFSGSISTPSTAAAIYRPADNTLAFSTANTERFRIQNNGRILIGNGAVEQGCSGNLDIVGDINGNGAELYLRVSNNNTVDNIGALFFGNNVDKSICMVRGSTHTANNTGDIEFHTSVAGTMAEKVRIYAQMGVSMQTNNTINNSGNQQNGVGYNERTRIYPYWVSDTGACRFNITMGPGSTIATPRFWIFTNATYHMTGTVEIGANTRTNSPNNAVQRYHHSKWNVGLYGEGDNDFSGARWRDSQMTQKGNTIDTSGGYYYVHTGHSEYGTNANQYQNMYGGWFWHLDNGSYWQGQPLIFDMYFSAGGTNTWYAYIND